MTHCSKPDCTRKAEGLGLCRRHYDAQRPPSEARELGRLLRTRARNRAMAALVERHRAEFEDLYATAYADAQVEHARLVAVAAERRVEVLHLPDLPEAPLQINVTGPVQHPSVVRVVRPIVDVDPEPTPEPAPRLLPGPRPPDETVEDRLREDVGRCGRCATSHDAGHRCPECSNRADRAIAMALRAGRSPEWIVATVGEAPATVLRVQARLRSLGDAEVARLRGLG